MSVRKGATREEWAAFDMLLGLTEDLLPVVSDPAVKISPNSKMQAVGKTPSIVNGQGFASGIPDWTSRLSTDKDVKRWSADPRLGICLQTRHVRALDIDIDSKADTLQIEALFRSFLGIDLPVRRRSNSAKILVLIHLEGDYQKRAFKTQHGLVEFLATGQQCIVAGTHTSGERYQWDPKLSAIPTVTPEEFESLWSALVERYAIEKPTTTSTSKKETLNAAIHSDPLAQHLLAHHWVYSTERDGRLNIRCPNEAEHSGPSSESATVYYPANTGGYARGHFDCKHAHCQHLSDEDFQRGVGYDDLTFDDLSVEVGADVGDGEGGPDEGYPLYHISEFRQRKSQGYHIKHVIPKADMVMVFGPPGAGKSFAVFDMGMAIARGVEWHGNRVTQGRVAYLIAEGAGGFNSRVQAYTEYHGIDSTDLPFFIIPATPNFLKVPDVKRLITTVVGCKPDIIVVDTWAQVTAGGNENSGEDMGLALNHCRRLREATGATILIIHHSGKDETRGARGWSGLKGAADAELEVARNNDDRVVAVTKLKDGIEGKEFGFKLNVVTVGVDEDGDDLTSCVVLPSEVSRAQVSMGKYERIVYEAARDGLGLDGVALDVNSLLDGAVNQIPFDPTTEKRDRRRDLVLKAYKKCLEREFLVEIEGRVECK